MAKKKTKVLFGVLTAVLVAVLAVIAYIFIGVVGFDNSKPIASAVSERVDSNINTNKTEIDETVTYQAINGFGASACWWSQDIGKWENSEEIINMLYSKDNGIGLNIYRYNLGAGSKGDEHILTENRGTECFLNADGSYDFTADSAAQNCLSLAKKSAGDDLRVTLFSNSAPVLLTKNGAGYGAPIKEDDPWVTNLDSSNYEAFADYIYKSAEYFVNDGYRVTDVSPINEPQYSWAAWYNDDGTYSVNQEGCHYSKTEARDLLNVMINKFDESELDKKGVKISAFDSGAAEGKGSTTGAYLDCILGKGPKYVFKNKAIRNYFSQPETSISMHSYWSSAETKQEAANYLAEKYPSYNITSSEYCQMTNDENTGVFDLISKEKNGTNGMTIEYGVAMAKVIVDDLTILNSKEWNWWTACSYGVYTDGLIYLNPDNHKDIQTSKRYWCLGNFSKFINEGATRIACSSGIDGVASCAFVNQDDSRVVVYVNTTNDDAKTSLKTENAYSVYTTSDKLDLQQTAEGEAGETEIEIPAMSVVTVVM
ncbi:MAG: hypothetical protein NC213_03915 [Acetobacter sp.]|nr:hypothetical protein [Bacteroides sp.]MCM1340869.1 hypothetical protein [Acetobacter sp.]MCM1432574.1 hypothetical protein [Clostridiales bacterium]